MHSSRLYYSYEKNLQNENVLWIPEDLPENDRDSSLVEMSPSPPSAKLETPAMNQQFSGLLS
jgi:hypothetical protein